MLWVFLFPAAMLQSNRNWPRNQARWHWKGLRLEMFELISCRISKICFDHVRETWKKKETLTSVKVRILDEQKPCQYVESIWITSWFHHLWTSQKAIHLSTLPNTEIPSPEACAACTAAVLPNERFLVRPGHGTTWQLKHLPHLGENLPAYVSGWRFNLGVFFVA